MDRHLCPEDSRLVSLFYDSLDDENKANVIKIALEKPKRYLKMTQERLDGY